MGFPLTVVLKSNQHLQALRSAPRVPPRTPELTVIWRRLLLLLPATYAAAVGGLIVVVLLLVFDENLPQHLLRCGQRMSRLQLKITAKNGTCCWIGKRFRIRVCRAEQG